MQTYFWHSAFESVSKKPAFDFCVNNWDHDKQSVTLSVKGSRLIFLHKFTIMTSLSLRFCLLWSVFFLKKVSKNAFEHNHLKSSLRFKNFYILTQKETQLKTSCLLLSEYPSLLRCRNTLSHCMILMDYNIKFKSGRDKSLILNKSTNSLLLAGCM